MCCSLELRQAHEQVYPIFHPRWHRGFLAECSQAGERLAAGGSALVLYRYSVSTSALSGKVNSTSSFGPISIAFIEDSSMI